MNGRMTLVFDWGDTLMRVFDHHGPMAEWSEVAEVEGVVEALEALLPHARMAVATNAADSTPEQVWKALRRVGLGEYFLTVFTAATLGSQKPQPGFFRKIAEVLDRTPEQLVMIGDGYTADVVGAKKAGWQAVWFNTTGAPYPGGHPLHDAEIIHMADLPDALHELGLPDVPTCIGWLQSYGAPHNVMLHVQTVAAAAYLLAGWLRGAGQPVNPILTHRGGLLHDIAKLPSIHKGPDSDHARMARDILLENYHQPELAEIADRHMIIVNADDPRYPHTWEEKLVHFADKLAEGSRLVALEDRLQALQRRYPASAGEIAAGTPTLLALQDEICGLLAITPEEMLRRLQVTLGT